MMARGARLPLSPAQRRMAALLDGHSNAVDGVASRVRSAARPKPGPCRSVAAGDFTEEQIAALERELGASIRRPR